jgi:hypothetical protein
VPIGSAFAFAQTFVFVELSFDIFTFLIDYILFSMLQNYLDLFLFYDPIFACVSHMHDY